MPYYPPSNLASALIMTPGQDVSANTTLYALGNDWYHPTGATAPDPITEAALLAAGFRVSNFITFSSISELSAYTGASPLVSVLGRTSVGDGGEGVFYWDVTSTATSDGATIVDRAGNIGAGRWVRQYDREVSVSWFGATGDGVTDDRDAINNANSSGGIYFRAGTYLVNSDITITPNIKFLDGAKLKPASGVTITVLGSIDAGDFEVFDISAGGSVVSTLNSNITLVNAAWFGVPIVSNSALDRTAQFQAAVDFAQEARAKLIFPSEGGCQLTAPITFKHGRNSSETFAYSIDVDFNNFIAFINHNSDGFRILPRCLLADQPTGRAVASINFRNLIINGNFVTSNNHTSARALVCGNATHYWEAFQNSLFDNILAEKFLQIPFVFENGRHCVMERLIARDEKGGVLVRTASDAGFVGDMTFRDCSFSGTETQRPVHVSAFAPTVLSQARGIRFEDCVIYGSGTYISSSTVSTVADIWFDDCAWDGPGAPAGEDVIEIFSAAGGKIVQVFFDEPYIVNYTGRAIFSQSDGPSVNKSISIRGGSIRDFNSASINLVECFGTEGVRVNDVDFQNNTASSEIRMFSCTHFRLERNDSQDSTITQMILVDGASDDFKVTDNMAHTTTVVTNSATPSPINSLVANNLSVAS